MTVEIHGHIKAIEKTVKNIELLGLFIGPQRIIGKFELLILIAISYRQMESLVIQMTGESLSD